MCVPCKINILCMWLGETCVVKRCVWRCLCLILEPSHLSPLMFLSFLSSKVEVLELTLLPCVTVLV